MKPTFIALKEGNKIHYAINSQDIKVVSFNADGRVVLLTSQNKVKATITTYAVTKLKKELTERYHAVTISSTSVKATETRKANNAILFIQDDSGETHIIFPKGLNRVELRGAKLSVFTFGGKVIDIDITNIKDNHALEQASKLLNLTLYSTGT